MIPESSAFAAPFGAPESCGAGASAVELLGTRRCVAAIDMDCFYAQCEELRRPDLKGKPVGVQQKALVITSNYAARAFGIQKGDSLQVVKEKCPEITICNGEDLTFYGQVRRLKIDFTLGSSFLLGRRRSACYIPTCKKKHFNPLSSPERHGRLSPTGLQACI